MRPTNIVTRYAALKEQTVKTLLKCRKKMTLQHVRDHAMAIARATEFWEFKGSGRWLRKCRDSVLAIMAIPSPPSRKSSPSIWNLASMCQRLTFASYQDGFFGKGGSGDLHAFNTQALLSNKSKPFKRRHYLTHCVILIANLWRDVSAPWNCCLHRKLKKELVLVAIIKSRRVMDLPW